MRLRLKVARGHCWPVAAVVVFKVRRPPRGQRAPPRPCAQPSVNACRTGGDGHWPAAGVKTSSVITTAAARPAPTHHTARAPACGGGVALPPPRGGCSAQDVCSTAAARPAVHERPPPSARAQGRRACLGRRRPLRLNSDTNGRRRPASAHRPMLAPNPLCVLTGRCRRSQAGGGRDAQVRLEPSIITAAARPAEPATMRVRLRAGAAVTGWRRPP